MGTPSRACIATVDANLLCGRSLVKTGDVRAAGDVPTVRGGAGIEKRERRWIQRLSK